MALTPGHKVLAKGIIYNSGRILTYATAGLLFSAFGKLLPIGPYQNALSTAFGITLIVFAIARFDLQRVTWMSGLLRTPVSFLKNSFGILIPSNTRGSYFILGVLNGLLPCGLTFVALSYCLLTSSPVHGAIFMAMFGMGTLPVMLGMGSVVSAAANRFHWNFGTLTSFMMILSGVILLGRAYMDMGIMPLDIYTEVVICR